MSSNFDYLLGSKCSAACLRLTALCSGEQSARWQEITEFTALQSGNFLNPWVYWDGIKACRPQKEINGDMKSLKHLD